jgi:3-oxo-5alpha-steroid 4-dehydrogenase
MGQNDIVGLLSFASPWDFIYAPGELCKGVLVDGRGARFVAETSYGADIGDAVFRDTDGIGWLILDQTILEESLEAGAVLGDPVASADTFEELAEQLELNVDVLLNTIEFYNTHAANGEDPLLHKHEEYLQPLETGQFVVYDYGVAKGIPFITLGGLRATMEAQILSVFDEPIQGLYGSGRVAPGLSQEYYVSGSALADCTFWGRVSGRAAAAAQPWE